MEFKSVKVEFKVVGIKGRGAFENLSIEVPKLAKQLISRSDEIQNHLGIEIALFEPKRGSDHHEGEYYVGLKVKDSLKEVPIGMDFIEIAHDYVSTRGKISNIGNLHSQLLRWVEEQGHTQNFESYIVETYHPIEEGEEEVQIYLPIFS
ncbi:GyrI-like domain-containing protein [Psychrobacillus psychrodurans]|uniref:GyrI-like domain-containing protein n=1 Tax=Psychrobacillus psychrodurans TaxID=126157 RepID=UPI0008F40C74|nr:GyrI-like domain-containing protein [Psychrobacillus psychrodurans]MCZ8539922.1 GyrI-like domain-containing protein [Psychrobacillus psychrodurans]SFM54215.1 Integron-associated effector binding protein [Psychrobacillus psychrodurans]